MVQCNQQYKDCMFECEAESMQWLTVNMEKICKGVYMGCIHECDRFLTIH
ncbi:hypothetical protein NP493_80g03044 [Ridgeia piscesae]|uniref:Uncharacterized protein n=1 Tax=Ridgeia piscesae TaxID=27915 RepID=A0AAD9P9G3_RIDPI|nr:hypothetical protein NP493_80g03044 [Ridgeia piscesae]